MKRNYLISLLIFFAFLFSFGQETEKTSKENPFAAYLESPVFYGFKNGNFNSWVVTANLEYLLKTSENYGISFSAGYGRDFRLSKYDDDAFNFGINNIFGKKHHFIEVGGGIGIYSGDVYHSFRFGYRLHLFDRLMFRVAYTPYIRLWRHTDSFLFDRVNDITLSLGYRFGYGKNKSERKNDLEFGKIIHSVQLNSQPFFRNYDKKSGHLENLNLEILLLRLNRIRVLFEPGFGMAVIHRKDYSSEEIVIPVGINVLIGESHHFIEAGINFTGRFEYRYYLLEPKAGYRIYLWKHFTAHLLYSPYFWLSNKENRTYIKKDFVNSFTVGLGYKF
jgi:hypothetical protein